MANETATTLHPHQINPTGFWVHVCKGRYNPFSEYNRETVIGPFQTADGANDYPEDQDAEVIGIYPSRSPLLHQLWMRRENIPGLDPLTRFSSPVSWKYLTRE